MKIFFTLDYELYFGDPTGTVEKCILYPTNRLIEICDRTGALMTFFIDSGYLIKLKEFSKQYPELETEYDQVCCQIRTLKKGTIVNYIYIPTGKTLFTKLENGI